MSYRPSVKTSNGLSDLPLDAETLKGHAIGTGSGNIPTLDSNGKLPNSVIPAIDRIFTQGDNRNVATSPDDYYNNLVFKGLKNNSTIGNPSGDTYSYLFGLRGWSDNSGGNSHEIAFNNSGIFVRKGGSSWDAWERVATTLSVYPVGSIYLTEDSTSPASLFGGTWVQLKDRFLLGAGSTYLINSFGGESTHTLTVNEMPEHYHDKIYALTDSQVLKTGQSVDSVYNEIGVRNNSGANSSTYKEPLYTSKTGGGASHNNMPPYRTCYMWKRLS